MYAIYIEKWSTGGKITAGPGSNFLAGPGVLILAWDLWSWFGAQSDLLKLWNYLKIKKKIVILMVVEIFQIGIYNDTHF